MATTTSVGQQRSPNILIVDDERGVRSLLVRWLSEMGYCCMEAGRASQAWQILETCDIDLVTLDLKLPDASGLEFLPRLKRVFEDTQVIVLTALEDIHTAIATLTAGAAGYITKPVRPEALNGEVTRALQKRQQLLERRHYTQSLEQCVDQQIQAIHRAHEETVYRLAAAAGYRDEETGAHTRRVGLCSELLARRAGWPDKQSQMLRLAAPMHDVGKIGIPDAILRKPGKLTPYEYEIMKRHTAIGFEILGGSQSPVLRLASEIALRHHERWDGGGYPSGLSGTDIPQSARIVAIVDVYDALTHDRVYRPALSREEAADYMKQQCGRHFDPELLNVFLAAREEFDEIARATPDETWSVFARASDLELPNSDRDFPLCPDATLLSST